MNVHVHFGTLLHSLRVEREWSLRDLANRINFNRGYIGKIEQGKKLPDRQFAKLADTTLDAHGTLVDAWQSDRERRDQAEQTGQLIVASTRDSLRLIAHRDEQMSLDDLSSAIQQLSIEYLSSPQIHMLQQGVELRSEALGRLHRHHYRLHELKDLYLIIGRIQGVLAYAALDLGDPHAAMTHAEAAWQCAEITDDDELRIWTRGTQSLIARFEAHYRKAEAYVRDGLHYRAQGSGKLRLLCGYAQCRANLGDSIGANESLNQALHERKHLVGVDSVGGIFAFDEAKQHYYAGSSLIWLNGGKDAKRAVSEAATAIEIWENQTPEHRSLDDEALAHIYQGTASLQLGDLDAADAAIRPILDLPPERQISWIRKRLARFSQLLREEPYVNSRNASQLFDEIQEFAA